MNPLKEAIGRAVDGMAGELDELSRSIHSNPELGYAEVKACGWLAEFLSRHGFAVEKGVAGVATALRGVLDAGPGPTIAILCEYDALPGIGHACGHNVIAGAGAGAGAALAAVRDRLPGGRILVLGTPAEEGGGGKVKLLAGGAFEGVDCAIMIHGFDRTLLHQDMLGIARVAFEFKGKAAHASVDPWAGVNALDACIQTFNAVGLLRQQMRPEWRVHGIITHGGEAANIIPERAAATFYVRAPRLDAMWELYHKVVACAEGAARAAGAGLEVTQLDYVYEPLRSNRVLLDLFAANMAEVGLVEGEAIAERQGSSDIGNISQALPTIHPMVAIAPLGTNVHTRDFAAAAVQPMALAGLLAAAKTMAATALDLLEDPARVEAARAEFAKG